MVTATQVIYPRPCKLRGERDGAKRNVQTRLTGRVETLKSRKTSIQTRERELLQKGKEKGRVRGGVSITPKRVLHIKITNEKDWGGKLKEKILKITSGVGQAGWKIKRTNCQRRGQKANGN